MANDQDFVEMAHRKSHTMLVQFLGILSAISVNAAGVCAYVLCEMASVRFLFSI